jgi:hypothetical protein
MKSLGSTRLGGIILALALALGLSACSAIKLGYNSLPNLAFLWLDGYVDFSDEQQPLVRDELARLHTWHRQQELPRLLELLARMEQMAPGEFTAQQACAVVADVRVRLNAVAEQAAPRAIAIASSFTGRELRYLSRKFRRKNEQFHKEWVAIPAAERHDKRFQKMVERLETFYGRLDEPQRAALRQRLAQSVYDPARTATEWQRRQAELLELLHRLTARRGVPEAEAGALLRGWLARIEQAPDPAYRAYQEALLQEGCSTVAAVHQSTSAAQREQAANRLRAYQRDVRELAAQQP